MWSTFEWFQLVRRFASLVGDDLVQFRADGLLSILVEAVELAVRGVGGLPVPLVTHRRCYRPVRCSPSHRHSRVSILPESLLHLRSLLSDLPD